MAKVSFTKINKIKNISPINITIENENILVQQYLPVDDKLGLIQQVVEQAGDGEEGFYNSVKLKVFFVIEMVKFYTNINFTEKQLEDKAKLYDLLILNHIWEKVEQAIPKEEVEYVWDSVLSIAREVTNYNHSALGILKSMKADYNDLDLDATQIEDKLANEGNLSFLKEVLEKMG